LQRWEPTVSGWSGGTCRTLDICKTAMPVRFLTAEQEHRYGRFAGSPSIEPFARYFHLDDADHEFVNARRQELPRLGSALTKPTPIDSIRV
jgi:hypothetical protein